MKRTVTLTEREWRTLPVVLARALVAAMERDGFTLAGKATGEPTDRISDYITGVLATSMPAEDDPKAE